jgi:hypothetical protein
MKLLLLIHVAATLIMFGVILVVQIVHYPLFGQVGAETYVAYQAGHMRLITYVVFPPMVVELVTAVLLVWWQPFGLPGWQLWLGLALVGVIWGSTAFLQVPLHSALTDGFDATAHRRLVASNWVRTLAWGARSVLVLALLAPLLRR